MDFLLTCTAVKDICLRKMDTFAPEQHGRLLYFYSSMQDIIPATLDRNEVSRMIKTTHKASYLPDVLNDSAYFRMWFTTQEGYSWNGLCKTLAESLHNYPSGFEGLVVKPDTRTRQLYMDDKDWLEIFQLHPEMVLLMLLPFAPPLMDERLREILIKVENARDIVIIEG